MRGKKHQEAVKITDVLYIYSYFENQVKPVNEDSPSLQSAGLTIAASSYALGPHRPHPGDTGHS